MKETQEHRVAHVSSDEPINERIQIGLEKLQPKLNGRNMIKHFHYILGNITPRELETLYWAANGLSAKKTASHLNMSVHTVHSYRKSCIRKLQANSITHAVYVACQRGLI